MLKIHWDRKGWGRKVQKVYTISAQKKFWGPEKLWPD